MSPRRPLALAGTVAGAIFIAASLAIGASESRPDPMTADPAIGPSPSGVATNATVAAPVAAPMDAPAPAAIPSGARSGTAALAEGWRILVPRLGIDLPLRNGDLERDVARQRTPEGAAFRLPGSALPGAGNTVLYAHARKGMFIALWAARVGDRVELVAPDGRVLAYRLMEIHPRVGPTDIGYLLPTDDERITLQTSTGPLATDPRFVAIARPER